MDATLEVANHSIVLLKNEGNILPLKKNDQKIAIIGPLADDKNSPLGNWRTAAENNSAVSVLEAMREYKGNKISHAKGVKLVNKIPAGFHEEVSINETDKTGILNAKKIAKDADVVIMVLGEYGFQSGEGRSRTNLDLPGFQQELLEEVYKVNKNIVLVLMNGRPLILNWHNENLPAIVEAWHLGSLSGTAISNVLYGDFNPGGKLPMSFPRSVGQLPLYYNYKSTGRPGADGEDAGSVFWSHYQDELNSPLYPFGYGLSYTTFSISEISLSSDEFSNGESINASVSVSNTGNIKGREVIQLYIQDKFASATRPVRELKGFETVDLEPGESKTVEFIINEKLLEFYNGDNKWVTEPGEFNVFIGNSSQTTNSTSFNFR